MICSHCRKPFTFLFTIEGLLSDVPDQQTVKYCERALERGMDPDSRIEVWGCQTAGCCRCRSYKDGTVTRT